MRRDPYRVIEGLGHRRARGRGRRGVLRHQAEVRARGLRAAARGARDGRGRDARRPEGLHRRRARTSTSSARRRRSSRSSRAATRCRRCCRRTSAACSPRCSSGGRPTSARDAQVRATRPSSTTSRRSPRRRTSWRRARRGSDRWARRALPARSSSRSSAMSCAARCSRSSSALRFSRARRVRWPEAGAPARRRALRRVEPGACRGRLRHAADVRGHGGPRHRTRSRGLRRLRRRAPTWRASLASSAGSSPSSRAVSARRARPAAWRSPTDFSRSRRASGRTKTSRRSTLGCAR